MVGRLFRADPRRDTQAMSRERVEVILRAYEAFNRGAWDESDLNFSSDFVFVPPPILPETGDIEGSDAMASFLRTWGETFDDFGMELEEAIDAGENVLVMAAVRGSVKDSGAEVRTPSFAHVWSFRGDEVVRMESMPNRATAMETLGLTE
jgi:ketosteroid isomerase-like protein